MKIWATGPIGISIRNRNVGNITKSRPTGRLFFAKKRAAAKAAARGKELYSHVRGEDHWTSLKRWSIAAACARVALVLGSSMPLPVPLITFFMVIQHMAS